MIYAVAGEFVLNYPKHYRISSAQTTYLRTWLNDLWQLLNNPQDKNVLESVRNCCAMFILANVSLG